MLSYIGQRASFVTSQLASLAPQIPFAISTNSGNDFRVGTPTTTLEGTGWINVRSIRLAGSDESIDVTWLDQAVAITVPLSFGSNAITLQAYDFQGLLIPGASDSITITSSVGDLVSQSLRVTEVHYNPADPTAAEAHASYTDNDDFEFIELTNIGSQTISLDRVKLVQVINGPDEQGVAFDFATGAVHQLAAGQSVLVTEDSLAFQCRYGNQLPLAGQWSGGLGNASEMITVTSCGVLLQQFTYRDDWYPETDGGGRSLQIVDAGDTDLGHWNLAANWRPSGTIGGAPGFRESYPGDANRDGRFDWMDFVQCFKPVNTKTTLPGTRPGRKATGTATGTSTARTLSSPFRPASTRSSPRPPVTHWLPPWMAVCPGPAPARRRVYVT